MIYESICMVHVFLIIVEIENLLFVPRSELLRKRQDIHTTPPLLTLHRIHHSHMDWGCNAGCKLINCDCFESGNQNVKAVNA